MESGPLFLFSYPSLSLSVEVSLLIPFHRNCSQEGRYVIQSSYSRSKIFASSTYPNRGLFYCRGKVYNERLYFVGHEVVSPGSIANECLTALRLKNRKRRQAISTRLATPKPPKIKTFYHSVSIKVA